MFSFYSVFSRKVLAHIEGERGRPLRPASIPAQSALTGSIKRGEDMRRVKIPAPVRRTLRSPTLSLHAPWSYAHMRIVGATLRERLHVFPVDVLK